MVFFSAIHFIRENIIQCQTYRSNYQAKHEPSSSTHEYTKLTDNVRSTGATYMCIVLFEHAFDWRKKMMSVLCVLCSMIESVQKMYSIWVDFSTCSHDNCSLLISDVVCCVLSRLSLFVFGLVFKCLCTMQFLLPQLYQFINPNNHHNNISFWNCLLFGLCA